MKENRPRLSVTARYCLEVFSRGPRNYGAKNHAVRALARRGLVELLPAKTEGAPRSWAITEPGLSALKSYRNRTDAVPPPVDEEVP